MKDFKDFWIALGITALWFIVATHVYEQRAERTPEPQQWMIPVNGRANGDVRVHVIDTTGVCLYVVRDSYGPNNTVAIAAVLKDQLPKGAGCQ